MSTLGFAVRVLVMTVAIIVMVVTMSYCQYLYHRIAPKGNEMLKLAGYLSVCQVGITVASIGGMYESDFFETKPQEAESAQELYEIIVTTEQTTLG